MPKAIPNPEPPNNHNAHPSQFLRATREQANLLDAMQGMGRDSNGADTWESNGTLDLDLGPLPDGLHPLPPLSLESEFQDHPEGADSAEMDRLAAENAQLRSIIAELRDQLEAGGQQEDVGWAERQMEYESLLEEKSELIRSLHLKVQELEQRAPATPPTPKEEELIKLNEELERERCQLEQERRELEEDLRQFKEDEQMMIKQMREMEVQMARERAELARQRTDTQRLLDDIHHELERMERDQGLSDKIVQLRHRHQDVAKGKRNGAPSPTGPSMLSQPPTPPRPGQEEPTARRKDSGFFRRIFGQE